MYTTLQIGGDPTTWHLAQAIDGAGQVTGSGAPVSLQVTSPLVGTLLMSRQFAASVALSSPPEGTGSVPHDIHLPTPVLYLPSSAGPQVTFPGYVLPFGTDLEELASQIETAMTQRQTCTVPILGSLPEGQLVLNGAVLPFVVLCPATPGPTSIPSGTGSVPHD